MPKHYAQDVNVQSGMIDFAGTKTASVTFPVPFPTRLPSVSLTLDDMSAGPPYKLSVTRLGFVVKFQNPYTGSVSWQAVE